MFIKPLYLSADADAGAAPAPTTIDLNPVPIATDTESVADDAYLAEPEAPAVEQPTGDEGKPETALDAINKALDKPEEVAKDEAPPAPEKAADDASKAKLEELYAIPRGLSGEARARFKALSDHARQLDTQFSETKQQFEQTSQRLTGFESIIRDSGATAEMLSAHFNYIKAINTGDLEGALAFVEAERQALARAIGKPLEGVDLLADFPDLRQRVDDMDLDEATAHELANARRQQQRGQEQAQAQAQRAQTAAEHAQQKQARDAAISDVEKFFAEQKGKDIDHPYRERAVLQYLQSEEGKQILRNLPANLWLSHIKAHYASIPQAPRPSVPKSQQPLRPSGAGNVKATPTNSLDALNQALGYS